MRCGALEIKAVPGLEPVFFLPQRDHQFPTQHIEKLLTLMRIRIAAARLRRYSKQMRLHNGVSPSQQLHANPGAGLQNLSLRRTHLPAARSRGVKKIQYVGLIKSR